MTDRHLRLDSRAVLLLLGCCFLWGLQQIVAKATMPLIPPVMQAALRSAVAALLVWAWSARKGVPLFDRDGTLHGGLLAGLLFAAEFICIFVGLTYTTASRLVVLVYLSAVALAAVSFARGEAWPASWTAKLWASMFFQAVVVAFASYLVWFWLIRHYPATRLAAFTFLTPLFGLVLGWAILGEAITVQLVLALIGVAAGIWLVNRPSSTA